MPKTKGKPGSEDGAKRTRRDRCPDILDLLARGPATADVVAVHVGVTLRRAQQLLRDLAEESKVELVEDPADRRKHRWGLKG